MTRLTIDVSAIPQLRGLSAPVAVCDQAGETLGHYYPALGQSGLVQTTSPFSREELETRRLQRTGRPLPEILEDLAKS